MTNSVNYRCGQKVLHHIDAKSRRSIIAKTAVVLIDLPHLPPRSVDSEEYAVSVEMVCGYSMCCVRQLSRYLYIIKMHLCP